MEFSGLALKQLKKLDRSVQADILDYMDNRVAIALNPRSFGKSLRHDKLGLWRYRVRDYRIICELHDKVEAITVLAVGHRSTVYDRGDATVSWLRRSELPNPADSCYNM